MHRLLPAGLLAAWAVHDAEEWIVQPPWPGMPQRRMRIAIVVMGGFVTLASLAGVRTRGSSPMFRAATEAFGVHGVVHLVHSVLARKYTPGVLTVPLVVLPYAALASRAATRAYGPRGWRDRVGLLLTAPMALLAAHLAARVLDQVPAAEEPAC